MASGLLRRKNIALLCVKICIYFLGSLMKMMLFFISPLLFWRLLDHGASGVDIGRVQLMEGDSVTLHTGVKTNQQDRIRWYFNDIRIAQITGDLSKICTDVQCNEGTDTFKGRLKLDHQTGSLTITNITNKHSGVYKLWINSSNINSKNSFSVIVHGAAAERDQMKRKSVKEGESVTLDPGLVKNPNYSMTWFFNGNLIAEIAGDQSEICTDEQCDVRFRDRLKLNQTGSLTITNTRTTDSGLYKLQINSSRFDIIKTFSVTVTAVPDSIAAAAAVAAAVVVVVVAVRLVAAAGVIYCDRRRLSKNERMPPPDQENGGERLPLIDEMAKNISDNPVGWDDVKVATTDSAESLQEDDPKMTSTDLSGIKQENNAKETLKEYKANGISPERQCVGEVHYIADTRQYFSQAFNGDG